ITPTAPTACSGGTVAITASGGSTYTWSPGTFLNTTTGANVTATPTTATNYTVSGTDSHGCVGTKSLTVAVNALPTLTISPASPSTCNSSSVAITASGASTYSWSPATFLNTTTSASVTSTPTAAINYTVTGTNSNGCVNTASVAVTVNALPTITITPASATVCAGNTISLTASGATTYTWNTGVNTTSITPSPTVTTTYTVSGTNGSGCIGTKTVTITVNPLPTLTISPSSTPAICIGSSTTLTASGASTYIWSPATGLNNTTVATVTANPTTTTSYTVTGTNSNGCVGTQTLNLTVNALPVITTSPTRPVVLGGQGATVTASGASTYTWSPSTNLNTTTGATVTAIPQITTGYTVTGTDVNGCVGSSALSVGVELWQQTADTFHAPIYYNGNLGIGNNNPQAALDVTGDIHTTGKIISSRITYPDTTGLHIGDSSVVINTIPSSGSNLSYDKVSSSFGRLAIGRYNVAAYGPNSIAIGMTGAETDATSSMAIGYNVKTSSTAANSIAFGAGMHTSPFSPMVNSIANSLAIGFNSNVPTLFVGGGNGSTGSIGKVGIGTTSPSGLVEIKTNSNSTSDPSPFIVSSSTQYQGVDGKLFEVTYNGQAYAREIFVKVLSFPDYVFKKDYALMPLSEVEKYYKANQHLPEVPSENEVKENGLNVGDMNAILLKKIEELTLYTVELEKKIKALEEKVNK
ncbi:MAG TPA: hypothetical protein VKG26_14820, partial [Bacteroidia bacterium]|nr:hypothetical protein [Bacteroidia bacterium]